MGFIDDVAAMVAGETSDPIHQAILNSDYDCDRLDYLHAIAIPQREYLEARGMNLGAHASRAWKRVFG